MNRKVLSFSLAASLCLAGFSLADDMPGMPGMKMPDKTPTSQPAVDASAVDVGNTVCPVTNEKVGDSKLTGSYDGKLYHFCCDDCPKKFAKDPATYAKAVAADPAKYGIKPKP